MSDLFQLPTDDLRGTARDVLDHGLVRLVDYMGNDLSIVRAARCSYDAAWRAGLNEKSDSRLIRYLWRNHHSTPFESVELQFEVRAPIFVVRQWHRHRTWSFNELSGRYRELPETYYLPDPELIGHQSEDNKQARTIGRVDPGLMMRRVGEVALLRKQCELSFNIYRDLIESGWPRELARTILPLNTYTHMFAKVDLRNLMGFLDLRYHPHAQYEIRVFAEAMLELIRPLVPNAIGAWEEYRRSAATIEDLKAQLAALQAQLESANA